MIYEYLCKNCDREYVFEQKLQDKPKVRCPECKKHKLVRQISGGTGFVLKGGCWYKDGYSSNSDNSSTT